MSRLMKLFCCFFTSGKQMFSFREKTQVTTFANELPTGKKNVYTWGMRYWWILLFLLMLGCREKEIRPMLTETPAPMMPTIAPTEEIATPSPNTSEDGSAELEYEDRFTLKLWVPPNFSHLDDTEASRQFKSQLDLFERTHPEVKLDVQNKIVSGLGGIVNYLETGQVIAPSVLPDVALLPNNLLPILAKEKLIFPLDSFVSDDLLRLDGLYKVATEIGKVGDVLYGYPMGLTDYSHIAYDQTAISGTLSTHWSDMLGNPSAKLLLSADPNLLSSLLVQLYLSNNLSLVKDGEFNLEIGPLTKSFGYLATGLASKFLVAESFTLSPEDAWNSYFRGEGTMTIVDAAQFLPRWQKNRQIWFAPIPGIEGAAPPLVNGWVWIITTPDSVRQSLSAELIANLSTEQYLGTWSEQIPLLPANANAFNYWEANPYTKFLQQELARAHAFPTDFDLTQRANLAASVNNLLLDTTLNPPDVAQKALATLFPNK